MAKRWALGGLIATLLLFNSTCSPAPSRSPQLPGPAATPTGTAGPETPAELLATERWIEVSLREQMVRLHEGGRVVGEYMAAAGVGDRPETTTYPGMFAVQMKTKGPVPSAPGVYVSDVILFDWEHGNGIHSLPMDESGNVLDSRLGQPVSAGCVRTAQSAAVFDFAELGMKVWVH